MAISASKWGRVGVVPIDAAAKRELYLHHAVMSDEPRTRAQERATMRVIEQGHLARGFSTIGYSWVLFRSGRLYVGRGPHGLPAAQGGHNTGTLAICYVADLRTDRMSRRARLRFVAAAINVRVRRGVRLLGGHREAPGLREATTCPGDNGIALLPRFAERAELDRVRR